jgi:hypothetical protein
MCDFDFDAYRSERTFAIRPILGGVAAVIDRIIRHPSLEPANPNLIIRGSGWDQTLFEGKQFPTAVSPRESKPAHTRSKRHHGLLNVIFNILGLLPRLLFPATQNFRGRRSS